MNQDNEFCAYSKRLLSEIFVLASDLLPVLQSAQLNVCISFVGIPRFFSSLQLFIFLSRRFYQALPKVMSAAAAFGRLPSEVRVGATNMILDLKKFHSNYTSSSGSRGLFEDLAPLFPFSSSSSPLSHFTLTQGLLLILVLASLPILLVQQAHNLHR